MTSRMIGDRGSETEREEKYAVFGVLSRAVGAAGAPAKH